MSTCDVRARIHQPALYIERLAPQGVRFVCGTRVIDGVDARDGRGV